MIHFVVDRARRSGIVWAMTFEPQTHRQIIETVWGNIGDYAQAIDARWISAKGHRDRNSIPEDYWPAAIAGAKLKGYPLTMEVLARTKKRRANASRYEPRKVSF